MSLSVHSSASGLDNQLPEFADSRWGSSLRDEPHLQGSVTAYAGFFRYVDFSSRYTNASWSRQETRSSPDCILARILGASAAGECSTGQHYLQDEREPSCLSPVGYPRKRSGS